MQVIVLQCHRDLLQEILGLYIKKFDFFLVVTIRFFEQLTTLSSCVVCI